MNKKLNDLRKMSVNERIRKLTELKNELAAENAVKSTNTRPESPGKARNIRRHIARIHTFNRADEIKKTNEVKN
ncbi:MAG: 50S ribosomal protein L29 [Candidatus Diapherotrites archaeon]